VSASADQIYPFLADPTLRLGWMTELVSVDAAPGPVKEGDRFTGQSAILLHHFIGVSEVKEADALRTLVEEVVIGARFRSRWELAPEGSSTRVHHTIDVEFPAGVFSRLERWVLRRRLLRMQQSSLANLARKFA
jgi:hypothetical protein